MIEFSTKQERTNIIPLRIIGNICGGFAGNHIFKAMLLDEEENYGLKYKYHGLMWKYLNKPYEWWGTYYMVNMEAWGEHLDQLKVDMSGSGWDDYDENGIPYWDKNE